MTRSVCCDHGKMFFIYNLFYINFLQVFSIKFAVNLFSRLLVYFSGTTMEIRVTRPFNCVFYPWWPVWWPWLFYIMLTCTVHWNKSNQNKKKKKKKNSNKKKVCKYILPQTTCILNCIQIGHIFSSNITPMSQLYTVMYQSTFYILFYIITVKNIYFCSLKWDWPTKRSHCWKKTWSLTKCAVWRSVFRGKQIVERMTHLIWQRR